MTASNRPVHKEPLGWEEVVGFLDTPVNFLWLAGTLVVVWGIALVVADAEPVNNAFQALAFLVGGFWVLYQFVLRRSFESALEIDVQATTAPGATAGRFVVFVDVRVKNVGNRRISAPAHLTEDDIQDYENSVRYPCDLQIARIDTTSAEAFAGWFAGRKSGVLTLATGVPEHVHLGYEYTRTDKVLDFFMEPGESYGLGNAFLLPEGDYMAKVVFVGSRSNASEFWSRVTHFHVP